MELMEIKSVKSDPRRLLDFMKANRYGVYHKSNIFFRDFQYGLWRFLDKNQVKVPYADMEAITKDLIDDWEWRGILKRVNRMSFELNMPEYTAVTAAIEEGKKETEPPKGKPAPASGPVATEAPAATDAPAVQAAPAGDDPEKAAKIAELQAKMAAAKAKREAEGK